MVDNDDNRYSLEEVARQVGSDPAYFKRHTNRYRRILDNLPNSAPPLTILDAGVGYGFLAATMKVNGHSVSGVDLYYDNVAKRVCERFDIPLTMLNLETDELPHPDQHFDAIVLAEVIEHFAADPAPTLQRMTRVLKPNGRLIVTTPNRLSAVNRGKRLLGRATVGHDEHRVEVDGKTLTYGHQQFYAMGELEDLAHEAGYRILDHEYVVPGKISPGGLSGWIAAAPVRALGSVMPTLRNILLIVAQPE